LQIYIEPINVCNLRCRHCFNHDLFQSRRYRKVKTGLMDMTRFARAIDEISEFGAKVTLVGHGEPLLHPDIVEMTAYSVNKGLHTSIITNVTRLNPALSSRLIQAGLHRIVFSVEAVEKELYESIRIKARFEQVMYNLLNFLRLNEDAGHPVHTCAASIVSARTRPRLAAYENYFNRLPVDKIFKGMLLNFSGGSGLSGEVDIDALIARKPGERPMCRDPWMTLFIAFDGRICSCAVDYNLLNVTGAVPRDSILSAWNSPAQKKLRRIHLEGRFRSDDPMAAYCSRCNILWDYDEFDVANYREYVLDGVARDAVHFAPRLGRGEDARRSGQSQTLEAELARFAALNPVSV
jgi:MoaA/NifB/PqqE/SkfB family radical SAM enzyme